MRKADIEARHYWADHLDGECGIDWDQTKMTLCDENGFCCLGVAAALGLCDPIAEPTHDGTKTLYHDVKPFAGFSKYDILTFTWLNDHYGLCFSDIADIIRASCLPQNHNKTVRQIAGEYEESVDEVVPW